MSEVAVGKVTAFEAAQAKVRELVESGRVEEAVIFARENGVRKEYVSERQEIWRNLQGGEAPPKSEFAKLRRRYGLQEPGTKTEPEADAEDKAALAALAAVKAAQSRKSEPEEEPEEAEPSAGLPALVMPAVGELLLPVRGRAVPQVEALNQKHAVIGNYGGKCAVLSWERWPIKDDVLYPTFQTFSDFRNRYLNRYVEIETPKKVERHPVGDYWLRNPRRVTYEGVVFEPCGPAVLRGNRLNLWRGFAVEPRKGDWSLTRKHIYQVLGAGDPKAGRYIENWYADLFQKPGEPSGTVLTFQGEEGAGKGIIAHAILAILGLHGLPISSGEELTGAFSGHLQHCIFVFLDEAFWAGNIAGEGRLKSLITEPTINIHPKFFAPFQIRNMLHIMISTNNDWAVPARHGARRYAVFKVSDERVGDFAYFNKLKAELDNGGREAMLYDLLRLDLGDWKPKHIYKTAALVEQKLRSLRGLDAWIEGILQQGVLPAYSLPEDYSCAYPNRCLSSDLEASARKFDQYTNSTLIGLKLRDIFKLDASAHFNVQVKQGWKFPPLPDCRKLWELRNDGDWPWLHDVPKWRARGSILDQPVD